MCLFQASQKLTLTGFHAWILLIDDVNAALTTNNAAVFVAFFGGFK
jgi:hypothetical protein